MASEALMRKFFVHDQKYLCMSYIKNEIFIVFAVFSDYNKACEFAKMLHEEMPEYDIFVGETNKWLPMNPHPYKDSETQKFDNEKLQEIIDNYKKSYYEQHEEFLEHIKKYKNIN